MKKILLLALVAAMGGGLRAQDTLYQEAAPLSNYFYNNWVDTTNYIRTAGVGIARSWLNAKRFITQDTLQIYGIAAMLMNEAMTYYPSSYYPTLQSYLNHFYPDDPSLEHCEENLMLFQYHGPDSLADMQQLGEELPVHTLYTPATHYMMSNSWNVGYWDTIPKPIYERYFSAPQAVYDTFYVGLTQREGDYSKIDSQWHQIRPALRCFAFGYTSGLLGYDDTVAYLCQNSPRESPAWRFQQMYNLSYYIFPILTPEPPADTTVTPIDTTITPGDTTAVVSPEVMRRYVAVQPNPAHERVAVTSSFGLTAIEVYDSRGRQLLSAPASGFKVTLDISAWSRGTYLLRILTPPRPHHQEGDSAVALRTHDEASVRTGSKC